MKIFLACLLSVVAATAGNYYLTQRLLDERLNQKPVFQVGQQSNPEPVIQLIQSSEPAAKGEGTVDNEVSSEIDAAIKKEVLPQLAAINEDIEALNNFVLLARGDIMRVYHFVAGHKSFSKHGEPGQLFCPECGLIMDLENRQILIDKKMAELSAQLSKLKKEKKTDTQEYKDGVKRINDMEIELALLQKHLYRSAGSEKKVSTTTNTPAEPAAPAETKTPSESKASDEKPPQVKEENSEEKKDDTSNEQEPKTKSEK